MATTVEDQRKRLLDILREHDEQVQHIENYVEKYMHDDMSFLVKQYAYMKFVFPLILINAFGFLKCYGLVAEGYKIRHAHTTAVRIPLGGFLKSVTKRWSIIISCGQCLESLYTWKNFPFQIALAIGPSGKEKLVRAPIFLHGSTDGAFSDPQVRIIKGRKKIDFDLWGVCDLDSAYPRYPSMDFRVLAAAIAGIISRINEESALRVRVGEIAGMHGKKEEDAADAAE